MDDLQMQLLLDLHRSNFRQGPGGDDERKRAIGLAGLDRSRPLKIADVGCGTGASTILLAKELDADITAVDFVLPVHCWLENYYRPIQSRIDAFMERHGHSDQAKAIVDAERHEIAIYERFSDYYSYGVYVAKKV